MNDLKNDVLYNKEDRENIHEGLDLLGISGAKVDDNVRNNTDADTVGDAVGKRHKKECKECGNSLGSIFKIDTGDSTHHKESDKDKRGCGCKAGDRNEER